MNVIGVRFRKVGKIYYFDPSGFELNSGDHVIVETLRGMEYGNVVFANKEIELEEGAKPIKPIIRVATPQDDMEHASNHEREIEAFKICKEKISNHGLEMKLVGASYTFDRKKLLFYFTADGRVDFRALVKDLASVFRTRIELRQIGVRDEAKILGGVGICGRELCCHSFLTDFAPVSIKMAKEQDLSLNPTKISGTCGRLMCCLRNEQETYEYLNQRLPNQGEKVTTPDGFKGEVTDVNVLRQTVKVVIEKDDEKTICEYPISELKFKSHKKKQKVSSDEIETLKHLEDGGGSSKLD